MIKTIELEWKKGTIGGHEKNKYLSYMDSRRTWECWRGKKHIRRDNDSKPPKPRQRYNCPVTKKKPNQVYQKIYYRQILLSRKRKSRNHRRKEGNNTLRSSDPPDFNRNLTCQERVESDF